MLLGAASRSLASLGLASARTCMQACVPASWDSKLERVRHPFETGVQTVQLNARAQARLDITRLGRSCIGRFTDLHPFKCFSREHLPPSGDQPNTMPDRRWGHVEDGDRAGVAQRQVNQMTAYLSMLPPEQLKQINLEDKTNVVALVQGACIVSIFLVGFTVTLRLIVRRTTGTKKFFVDDGEQVQATPQEPL